MFATACVRACVSFTHSSGEEEEYAFTACVSTKHSLGEEGVCAFMTSITNFVSTKRSFSAAGAVAHCP